MQTCKNKLTAIENRDLFDQVPGGVTESIDIKRWHEFRAKYHRAEQLEFVADFPIQIDFELNSTCQMKCGFCTHGQGKVPKKLLGFERFKKVIDEGAEHGLVSIKLNYINEPLLVPDLDKYVKYARSRGVLNVFFSTNGLLLTEQMSRKLIDAKVSKIMISLDATTPETFKLMRNSSALDKIVTNICRLIELRGDLGYPLVRVNFLKTDLNAHEADEFLRQWEGVADMIAHQELLNRPGTTDVIRSDIPACVIPFKLVTIDSSGDILPCCAFSGRLMPLGHIDTMSVSEAWSSEPMQELKQLHQRGDYAQNEICKHCIGS